MNEAGSYEVVVGLEVHAQLLTRTKLFCADTTESGQEPNTQVSAISLGHPGTLPRMNAEAIKLAIKLGLACNCRIIRNNYFARKNYFYPDLPKGYQISQHTTPICREGFLEVAVGDHQKKIRINRIHMEEDAGKSVHGESSQWSDIDYNRAGMPLLEIVTEPDIRSAEEAFAFVTSLRQLVRHLGVCDGNMEQGSLRCDVNISVRKKGDPVLGTKVEVKNLNSIRFIKKAIESESRRLIALHAGGEKILQQTRGLDEATFTTFAIRTKEDEDDYRYFPEPDLPPFFISEETIEEIKSQMPALPAETRKRLEKDFGLSAYDAAQIGNDAELSALFFDISAQVKNYKMAANWIIGPVHQFMTSNDITLAQWGITAAPLVKMITLIEEGKISHNIAIQKVFPEIAAHPSLDVAAFVNDQELFVQTSSGDISQMIDAALSKHAQKIPEYKKGKKGLISLFVGEVMKLSNGKADARMVTQKIIEKLNT